MKLYVRAPYPEKLLDVLKTKFDEVVYEPWTETGERYYEDEMLEHLLKEKPDAVITELDRITKKVLEGYKGLKFIGDCRATPANLEVEECTKAGVPILTTTGRNTQAVAEMTAGLMICAMRNIIPSVEWAKEGGWVAGTTPYFLWMGHELQGKKLGLVGFGAISRALVKCLCGFDLDISFYDPYIPGDIGDYKKATLEEIFKNSDIVSLHLPVTPETTGLITKDLFNMMKPTALFCNLARSAIIDGNALKDVLKRKAIGGAVVTEQIFQWPGIGSLTIASIASRDYPVLMAIVILSAVCVLIANLVVDIAYAFIDPRIKYSK